MCVKKRLLSLPLHHMNMLAAFIQTLLLKHECVIVPQFGAFVVQYHSATIVNNTVLPPHATVSFTGSIRTTDGLLCKELSIEKGCTYAEANLLVEEIVHTLHREIVQGEQFVFGKLGQFSRNSEGSIEFLPYPALFLPHNLGYKTLQLPHNRQERKQITLTIPSYRNMVRYAAACAIGFAFWCYTPNSSEGGYANYANLVPINWGAIVEQRQEAEAAELAAQLTEEECAETVNVLAAAYRPKFHIVVAALDLNAANSYCRQLIEEGFPCAHVIPHKNGIYRVATHSFETKTEALKEMQLIRQNYAEHSRAWVFCQ